MMQEFVQEVTNTVKDTLKGGPHGDPRLHRVV